MTDWSFSINHSITQSINLWLLLDRGIMPHVHTIQSPFDNVASIRTYIMHKDCQ